MLSANFVVYSLGVIGFSGNLFLGFLILTKSPSILRVYSKLVLLSSLNELICLFCFVWSNMRVFLFREFMIIEFNGVCTSFGNFHCIVAASVAEQCCSITSEILCFCFYYRLRMIRYKFVSTKEIYSYLLFCIVLQCIIGTLKVDITVSSLPIFKSMYKQPLEWFDRKATYAFMYSPSLYTVIIKSISVIFSLLPLIFSLLIRSRIVISCANVSALSRNLHEVLIKALNAQLLILSCFAISALTFTLLDWRIIDNVFIQYAVFPIAMLQVTLSPYANIALIPPYRKACLSLMRSILRSLCGCTPIRVIGIDAPTRNSMFSVDR